MLCDLQIFSGKVYHPEPPCAQSLFLFPIVFGINVISCDSNFGLYIDATQARNARTQRVGSMLIPYDIT